MKKFALLLAIVLLGIFCGANSAVASLTVFNFRGPLDFDSSFTFTQDSITVTATAYSDSNTAYVNQSIFGLGVSNWILDNPQIDGCGPDDLLLLSFSEPVILQGAGFSLIGLNDEFQILNNDIPILTADIPHSGYFDLTFLDAALRTGTIFGFTVPEGNDDYMLASINIAQVPIPPAIILLSTGLVGLISIRRRLRK